MIASHPMWMFRDEEMRLFAEGEEIPHGWMDRPSPFKVPDPTKFDPDGDHSFGGSVKPQFEPVATEETTVIKPRRGRPPKVRDDAV